MTQNTTDAALLVELTVTKRARQYHDVLRCLHDRGWQIVATPRDAEFGTSAAIIDGTPDVSGVANQDG